MQPPTPLFGSDPDTRAKSILYTYHDPDKSILFPHHDPDTRAKSMPSIFPHHDYSLHQSSKNYRARMRDSDTTDILICMIKHDTTDDILKCAHNPLHPDSMLVHSFDSLIQKCNKSSTKNECVREILTHMSQDREQLTQEDLDVFCDKFNKDHSHKQGNTEIQKEILEFASLVCKPWGTDDFINADHSLFIPGHGGAGRIINDQQLIDTFTR